ncbi:MAG: hypothetical protein JWL90_4059 [Chthoniobacteraceae bacterium]|nr:hypothetical protein [Chthoniobacteraceae bacterium]
MPTTRGWLNTLQLGLLVSAIGWGISFYFTFASWKAAADELCGMGAGIIAYRPMFDYWLRMASSVFGCIGIASLLACVRPKRFAALIYLLGPFHFIIGITLAVAAYNNQLNTRMHPTFLADIIFCFLAGTLIQMPLIYNWKRLRNIDSAAGQAASRVSSV